jgi:hypothetical protein
MNKRYMDRLVALGACTEALEWAATQETPAKAWASCERGNWMLWWCGRLSGKPEGKGRKRLVLAACECARLSLKYVKAGEDRPLKAIETAERWAHGKATIEEVRAAADAADATALASASAAFAAALAAFAAFAAATAFAAADAAFAASSAAFAAFAAAFAAYAADARKKVLAQCAYIVRKHYPKPPMKEEK